MFTIVIIESRSTIIDNFCEFVVLWLMLYVTGFILQKLCLTFVQFNICMLQSRDFLFVHFIFVVVSMPPECLDVFFKL